MTNLNRNGGPVDQMKGSNLERGKTIKGEMLRVKGESKAIGIREGQSKRCVAQRSQRPFPRSTKRRSPGHVTLNLLVADRRSKRATPAHFPAVRPSGAAVAQILSLAYSYA